MLKRSTFAPPEDLASGLIKVADAYKSQAKEPRAVVYKALANTIKEQVASGERSNQLLNLNEMELSVPPQPLGFTPWTISVTTAKDGNKMSGKWAWNHARQQFSGLWNNGETSTAKIDRFDDTQIAVTEVSGFGTNHLVGVRTGNSVRGSFRSSNRSINGSWEASW